MTALQRLVEGERTRVLPALDDAVRAESRAGSWRVSKRVAFMSAWRA